MMRQKYVNYKQKVQEAKKKNIELQKQIKLMEEKLKCLETINQSYQDHNQTASQQNLINYQNQIKTLENFMKSKENKIIELQGQYQDLLYKKIATEDQDNSNLQAQNQNEDIKFQNQSTKDQKDLVQKDKSSNQSMQKKYMTGEQLQNLSDNQIQNKFQIEKHTETSNSFLIQDTSSIQSQLQQLETQNQGEQNLVQLNKRLKQLEQIIEQQQDLIGFYQIQNQKQGSSKTDFTITPEAQKQEVENSNLQELEESQQEMFKAQTDSLSLNQQSLEKQKYKIKNCNTLDKVNQEIKHINKNIRLQSQKFKDGNSQEQKLVKNNSLNQSISNSVRQQRLQNQSNYKKKNQRLCNDMNDFISPTDKLISQSSLRAKSHQSSPSKLAKMRNRSHNLSQTFLSLSDLNKTICDSSQNPQNKLSKLEFYEKKFNQIREDKNINAFKELTQDNFSPTPQKFSIYFKGVHKDFAEIQNKLKKLNKS